MSEVEIYEQTRKLNRAIAEGWSHLYAFGNELAKRHGYRSVKGMDAVHYYLIQKHNWTPQQLRDMPYDDIRLALSEEMHGWTLPKELRKYPGHLQD